MERARLSVGVKAAYQPRTLPTIMKALRAGESVGFVLDQYAPSPMGVPVVFFGARVDTLAAVGSLAERTGAAIIPVLQRRKADGRVHISIEPELVLGTARNDPREATQILASKVETWIRLNPVEWLWGHRRFKNAVWNLKGQLTGQTAF
jgi:KDO2-lipid IV(A) lauroyltransferase